MSESTSSPPGAGAPYYLAATFRDERQSRRAYQRIRDLLFASEGCDLSSYCFYVGPTWYVAIVGEQPESGLDQRLRTLLAHGTVTHLPDDVLSALLERRAQATEIGPWVEAHYGEHGDRS